MISLEGHRIIDLSWELVSRVTRMDQTVEEGRRDVYNMPWIVEETYNEHDGTIEHLVACNVGTVAAWPVGGSAVTWGRMYNWVSATTTIGRACRKE